MSKFPKRPVDLSFIQNPKTRALNAHLEEEFISTDGIEAKKKPKKKAKYNNKRTKYNGITYDSGIEAERAMFLDLMFEQKIVKFWGRQPRFTLLGIEYVADFLVKWTSGVTTIEDVKGVFTPEFKSKRKQLKQRFPELELIVLQKEHLQNVY